MPFQKGNQYGKYKKTWNKGLKIGTSGMEGKKQSEEAKKLISKNNSKHWKGKKFSDEHKKKLSENHADFNDEKSPRWKGDDVGYIAVHQWVKKHKGSPGKCEHCGNSDKKQYDWANVDHSYKRKLDDYMCLCRSCHRFYDIKNNNYQTSL